MSKTITLEELPEATRRIIEDLFESEEPVEFSRAGEPIGALLAYKPVNGTLYEMSPEEKSEVLEAIRQGEEDYAAGRYITLDEFKIKYAERLSGSDE